MEKALSESSHAYFPVRSGRNVTVVPVSQRGDPEWSVINGANKRVAWTGKWNQYRTPVVSWTADMGGKA
jgi:hypothetical protein